jgi:hypothetical protein
MNTMMKRMDAAANRIVDCDLVVMSICHPAPIGLPPFAPGERG